MKYQKIISLDLVHGYFASGEATPFRFEPTQDCEKLLRRFSLRLRATGRDFIIVKDIHDIREPLTLEDYFFDIALYPGDDHLPIYSDLDIDFRERRVYYLENSTPGKGQDINKNLTMVDHGTDKTFEAVRVILKPKKFMFSIDAAPGDTIRLADKKNRTVKEWDIEDSQGATTLYADVSRKPSGIFRVERNNTAAACYYADDHLYKEKPVVILGIHLSLADLKENENYASREYEVNIANRSIYWRYHVFVKSDGRKLGNLRIDNNNQKLLPGITFKGETIDEERKEMVFVSSKPIPMSERGYVDIELNEKETKGRPLIPNLPNPDISAVKYKDGKWFSDIFVYI